MCGRYTLTTPEDELLDFFGHPDGTPDHEPRYNIAPTQDAPVIIAGPEGPRIGSLRWGLVPWWADDPSIGNRLINARSETVASKPAFRDSFERRRCLVLADGFYEWKREESRKAPHWIHLPSRQPFAFAGVWDRWRHPDGEPVYSFAILTTRASPAILPIHPRMPVILTDEGRSGWLDPEADRGALEALLRPYEAGALQEWEVSPIVNAPANDSPLCIEPVGDD